MYKLEEGARVSLLIPEPKRLSAVLLALPELEHGASYVDVAVSCHHPSSQGNNDIFHRPAGRAMVRIWASMETLIEGSVEQLSFSVFVPVEAVVALVEGVFKEEDPNLRPGSGGITVPWSVWGHHTRITDVGLPSFLIRETGPSTSFCSVNPDVAYYSDFNAADAIRIDWSSPHFTPRSSLVVEPSQDTLPDFWVHPGACTSLPCRMHVLEFAGAASAKLGEDFLVTTTYASDGTESVWCGFSNSRPKFGCSLHFN